MPRPTIRWACAAHAAAGCAYAVAVACDVDAPLLQVAGLGALALGAIGETTSLLRRIVREDRMVRRDVARCLADHARSWHAYRQMECGLPPMPTPTVSTAPTAPRNDAPSGAATVPVEAMSQV